MGSPLDDILAAMADANADPYSQPVYLTMAWGSYVRLQRCHMTKRQFRRWRGRMREEIRNDRHL